MSSALQKINQQDDPCNKTGSLIFGIKLENFTNFSFHKTGVFLTWHLKASPEGAWHNNPMAELLTLKKKIKKNLLSFNTHSISHAKNSAECNSLF